METNQLKKKESFVFYRSFYEAIESIPDNSILYKAIANYALNREIIELDGIYKTVFILIKPQLDANWSRYESGCKPKSIKEAKDKQKKAKKSETEAKDKQNRANVNVNVNDINIKETYKESFMEWLLYKKQRNESYKSSLSKQKAFDNLYFLSGADPLVGKQIIDQSIANNWSGLFELKNKNNVKEVTFRDMPL